ncbi:MAG: thiamine/thiamine pyrophosphate ABC transporter permease [Aeromonadaceae bacterium]
MPSPTSAPSKSAPYPGHEPGYWWLSGTLVVVLLMLCGLGPLLALLLKGGSEPFALWHDPYLRHVIGFSLQQASLSTLLSLGLALPVARALHRRRFPGRALLLRLFGISLVLPVIIALFGLVAVHGQQGWLARLLACFGIESGRYLYGLGGILLAHLFFNMPLAARWLLFSLEGIPNENWRLASQLGMGPCAIWRLLEWPALRGQLAPLASLIFVLCFSSFTTVMALGGGPAATTLEVAVYQALRFDFDLNTAAQLACIHLLLCGLALALHHKLARPSPSQQRQSLPAIRPDRHSLSSRLQDGFWLGLAGLLFLPPLLAILTAGLQPGLWQALGSAQLWQALWTSLQIGASAALLAALLSLGLLVTSRHLRLRRHSPHLATLLESCGSLILLVPTAVLSTGLFILLLPITDLFSLGFWLVILLNALSCLPYTLRTLQPVMQESIVRYERLALSLGLTGWARWRYLEWPLLRVGLGRALGLAAVFSLGDLGAVALFGSSELQTLPWLLYQQLGSYQLEQAAATALLLLTLCLSLLWLVERSVGGQDARNP